MEAAKKLATGVIVLAPIALIVVGLLALFGVPVALTSSGEKPELTPPDTGPVEFAYFDAPRAESYLDQADGGLAKSIERKEEVTRAINATFSAGPNGQLGGSQQNQQGVVTTVTPQAADRFYTLLRQLRPSKNEIIEKGSCKKTTLKGEPLWLGTVDDEEPTVRLREHLRCIGAGDFVRIRKVQLRVPSLFRILPRLRYARTLAASRPSPAVPFYWPDRSPVVRAAERAYLKAVSASPRVMLVGAPHPAARTGERMTFVLPALYRGITREPSLLTVPVTVVGVLVSSSASGSYVDYPTVSSLGAPLISARTTLDEALGLCSKAHSTAYRRAAGVLCRSPEQILAAVEKAVTVKGPFAVVLPIAIYS